MKAARAPLDTRATGTMLLLCLLWGPQQVLLKLVADDIAPIMQIAVRSTFAALVLGVVVLRSEGRKIFSDHTLLPGVAVGALFALEFLLVAEGLAYTHASHVSVFLYTAPVFAALGLHLMLPEERLSRLQWLGVAIALSGVALSLLGKKGSLTASPNIFLGDLMALGAGIAWGATTVAIRSSPLSEAAPAKTLFYQMVIAAVVLMLFAVLSGSARFTPSTGAILSVAFQAIVVSLSSYLLWFWLLRRYLASHLAMLSFLTPLFGVGFGVWILDELLDISFVLGALLVLAGISLISGAKLLRR